MLLRSASGLTSGLVILLRGEPMRTIVSMAPSPITY